MKKFILYIAAATLISGSPSGLAQPQWQLQTRLTGNPALGSPTLLSVKAVSQEVGWICVENGTVYRTTNGGRNWLQTSRVATTEGFFCIDALDATTAVIGVGARIYRTTNGGQSWQAVYTATGPRAFWNGIHLFDAQNGIAMSDPPNAGGPFLIVKTTDGGTTWTPIANPPTPRMNEVGFGNCFYFYDNSNGWFGTNSSAQGVIAGRVFRTTDGGNTWNGFESGNNLFVLAVRFISPMVGIRTSANAPPILTRSTDGGQTWSPVENLPVADIQGLLTATSVSTASGHQLWLYGEAGTPSMPFILSSIDGGATWQQQTMATISGDIVPHMSAVSFGALSDSVRAWAITQTPSGVPGEVLTYFNRLGFLTAVKEQANLPARFALLQNYPNPFSTEGRSRMAGNPATTIRYAIPKTSHVTLKVFNLAGQEVATLVSERKLAGEYEVQWSPINAPSGMYVYRLQTGDFSEIRKLILMK